MLDSSLHDDALVGLNAQRAVWQEVFSQRIPGGPITRGFDTYFGTNVPNWPPFCFIEDDHTVGIPSGFLPARLLGNNQASNQGPALKDWTLEPILPALGDRAAKFITEATRKAKPFLVYMPLTSPHTPLAVNQAWKGKSGLGPYADFVMDDIGETTNLAAKHSERVAQMQALLEKLITRGRSTPGAAQQNDVEVRRFPQPPAAPERRKLENDGIIRSRPLSESPERSMLQTTTS
jgi:hypothetical protein